jgi:maltose O-acetyltransferase
MGTESIDRTKVGFESGPTDSPKTRSAASMLIRRVGKFVLRGTKPRDMVCYFRGARIAAFSGAESFGKRPFMRGKVCFHVKGTLIVGNDFRAGGHGRAVCIKVHEGGRLTLGDRVGMNLGTRIEARHDLRIGNRVMMAPSVSILDDSFHEIEPGWPLYQRPVTIGNNVWLGQNVVVLPGVTIGDNSVIGANSTVTRDIPPDVFAAGVPAKVVRKLEIPDGWERT